MDWRVGNNSLLNCDNLSAVVAFIQETLLKRKKCANTMQDCTIIELENLFSSSMVLLNYQGQYPTFELLLAEKIKLCAPSTIILEIHKI